MYKIAIIGSGYVGLVMGACLSNLGMNVLCVDNNEEKVRELIKGNIPIYEPGLNEIIKRNVDIGRMNFTTNISYAVNECSVIFIAVGTPPLEDGSADIQYVLQVAKDIGQYMNEYKCIINKSTVPVGTGQKVKETIKRIMNERNVGYDFDVVSNPEFLREGSAIYDFINPDRIVLGVETGKAKGIMMEIYKPLWTKGVPVLSTDIKTAELIKYASNAFLAMKISFINEMARFCEKMGTDVESLAKGIGTDTRIGASFLKPGPGYGGSCFPKDTKALASMGVNCGAPLTLIEQTIAVNESQKYWVGEKIKKVMGSLDGKAIGVLGITFKAGTDDMREAPSLVILEELAKAGASLRIYDPQGEKEGKLRLKHLNDSITFCIDEYDAMDGTDALVIITDWNQFRKIDLNRTLERMKGRYIFDFRNIFNKDGMTEKGFHYYGVGK